MPERTAIEYHKQTGAWNVRFVEPTTRKESPSLRANRRPIAIIRRSCSDSSEPASQIDRVFGSDSWIPGHYYFIACRHLSHATSRSLKNDQWDGYWGLHLAQGGSTLPYWTR